MISSRRSAGKVWVGFGGFGKCEDRGNQVCKEWLRINWGTYPPNWPHFRWRSFNVNHHINIGVPTISKKSLLVIRENWKELVHRSLHAIEDGSFLLRFVTWNTLFHLRCVRDSLIIFVRNKLAADAPGSDVCKQNTWETSNQASNQQIWTKIIKDYHMIHPKVLNALAWSCQSHSRINRIIL